MSKKVYQLHDKFTEEIIGSVICDDAQVDELWDVWAVYHEKYNSNTSSEADVYEFEQQYGESVGFEVIQIDFIQL